MFETIINFFKNIRKSESKKETSSKEKAKERLHLVLMQDRANVSADFLEMMKQEIIEVIKKYIEIEENSIDVRLTNEIKEDGTTGAPSLYANIPILNIKNEMKKNSVVKDVSENKEQDEEKSNQEALEQKTEKKQENEEEKSKKIEEKPDGNINKEENNNLEEKSVEELRKEETNKTDKKENEEKQIEKQEEKKEKK